MDDPSGIAGGIWRIYHDEDCEVYVNGTKALELKGFKNHYADIPLDEAALKALKAGRNVIAVHCRQTGGGQNIDVGLTVFRESAAR